MKIGGSYMNKNGALQCEKILPIAIGLNFVFPGAGYFYMGKNLLGFFAMFVILVAAIASKVHAWQ